MPENGAVDLHYSYESTGVRIKGGNFAITKLKREIRIFEDNAHTFLDIFFEKIPRLTFSGPFDPDPNGMDQQQKFILPFSNDKSLTYFCAKYYDIQDDRRQLLQQIETKLKKKEEARKEYNKAVQTGDSGALLTSSFRGDEYTIEMGNKPEATKLINVHFKYSEPLKGDANGNGDRVHTLFVPRHRKKRFRAGEEEEDAMEVDLGDSNSSSWIDEIEIIEPHGESANTASDSSFGIAEIFLTDETWEMDYQKGAEVPEGRKWKLYEKLNSNQTADRIIEGPNGPIIREDMRHMPIIAPTTDRPKNDLEIQIKSRGIFNPKITVESIERPNGSETGCEDFHDADAIVSVEISEKNIREQLGLEEDDDSDAPMEYIFLLDCSGSMSGNYMESTRRTLQLMIRSLDHGSKVIFCRFGSRHVFEPRQEGEGEDNSDDDDYYYSYRERRQSRQPRVMRTPRWIVKDEDDDEQLEGLQQWIDREMRANLGGTDIHGPLMDILTLEQPPDVYRNIIVMTDGAITNTNDVIKIVKDSTIKFENKLRFFSLGIGSGASKSLCEGIAKNGLGSAVYVLGKDRIQAKTMQILENASRPAIHLQRIILPANLQLVGYSQNPQELNMPIYGFRRFYLCLKSTDPNSSVFDNIDQIGFVINGQLCHLNSEISRWGNAHIKLKSFWAKQEIDFLEDSTSYQQEFDRQEVQTRLSIFGNTLCDYTAFVGVVENQEGKVIRSTVTPIQGLHHGGMNVSRGPGYMAAGGGFAFPPPPAAGGMMPARERRAPPFMMGGPPAAGGIGGARKKGRRATPSKAAEITEKPDADSRSDELINYSRGNGLWKATKKTEILKCLEAYHKNFTKAFEHLEQKIQSVEFALTILALAALKKYEAGKSSEWSKISTKAQKKLRAKQINVEEEIQSIIADLL